MTTTDDFTDQSRLAFCQPTQHEKSCPGIMCLEQIHEFVGNPGGSPGYRIPAIAADYVEKIGDLEVFLNVDRQRIQHRLYSLTPERTRGIADLQHDAIFVIARIENISAATITFPGSQIQLNIDVGIELVSTGYAN